MAVNNASQAGTKLDIERAEALEAKYDPEMNFRPVGSYVRWLVYLVLVGLGLYHYYTAGFGIPREQWHKGIHMGVVLAMTFTAGGDPAMCRSTTGCWL